MKMRKILSILLASLLVLSFAGCKEEKADNTNNTAQQTTQTPEKKDDVVVAEKDRKIVICWGDSITQGMAMAEGNTYPEQLQAQLGNAYKVINAGVPGENSSTIAARANVIATVLRNDVTFKKGEAQVRLDRELFIGKNGEDIVLKGFGNKLPIDNVVVGGNPYTIEFEQGTEKETHFYKLTRTDTSSALTLKKGTDVKFDYSKYYSGEIYCNIMLLGANDMPAKVNDLLPKYEKIGKAAQNSIMLIPFYGDDYAADFTAKFGDKALNLRKYFQTDGAKDVGITLTRSDERAIEKNQAPQSFAYQNRRGECHLNEYGYKGMAISIYKKGIELGYWK